MLHVYFKHMSLCTFRKNDLKNREPQVFKNNSIYLSNSSYINKDKFVFFLNKNIAFSSFSLEQRMNTCFFYLLSIRAHLVYEVAKDIFVWGQLVDLCPLSIDVGDTHVVEKSVVIIDRIKH